MTLIEYLEDKCHLFDTKLIGISPSISSLQRSIISRDHPWIRTLKAIFAIVRRPFVKCWWIITVVYGIFLNAILLKFRSILQLITYAHSKTVNRIIISSFIKIRSNSVRQQESNSRFLFLKGVENKCFLDFNKQCRGCKSPKKSTDDLSKMSIIVLMMQKIKHFQYLQKQ